MDPRRRWWQQWPIALVLALVVVGLALSGLHYVRKGPALVGAAALLGALLRAVLPDEDAGMLAVRRRAVDVAVLGGIGIATLLITLTIQPLSS